MATQRRGLVSPATGSAMLGYLHNLHANLTPDLSIQDSPHAWARVPGSLHPAPLPVRALGPPRNHHASTLVGCQLGSTPASSPCGECGTRPETLCSLVGFRCGTLVPRRYSLPGFWSGDKCLCSGVQSWGAVPSAPGDNGNAAWRHSAGLAIVPATIRIFAHLRPDPVGSFSQAIIPTVRPSRTSSSMICFTSAVSRAPVPAFVLESLTRRVCEPRHGVSHHIVLARNILVR
jgi:hypothetical protein